MQNIMSVAEKMNPICPFIMNKTLDLVIFHVWTFFPWYLKAIFELVWRAKNVSEEANNFQNNINMSKYEIYELW